MTAQDEAELRRRVVAHDWWHTIVQARLLSAAIQRELAPILERLQRLEDRLN